MSRDLRWMAAAARLANRAQPISRPNPGVGALILRGETVIARGWTNEGGRPHAEAHALAALPRGGAEGATMFVTLEPCAHRSARGPACADLVAESGFSRIVIGQLDPDPRTGGKGIERLRQSGIAVQLLNDAASARSLAPFLIRMRLDRPHVTLKLAMSLDGCIALRDGSSRWMTGDDARRHCHAMRAQSDAILVGGGTWRADRPRLDVRLPGLGARSPDRVVLTGRGAPEGVLAIARPEDIASLDGVQRLYVEGGARTAASFLLRDLVDELHLYRAPILIGDGLRSLDALGIEELANAHDRWLPIDHRQLGKDVFSAYVRDRSGAAASP